AGGGLAAIVCQRARQFGGPAISLQVLFCPALDMSIERSSRRAFAKNHFLSKATIDWTFAHYCPSGVDRHDPRVSPLCAVDFSCLPPAIIHTAEFDPLRDEGKAYADRLEQAGVRVGYNCHDGLIHHFYGMATIIPYA